MAEAQEPNDLEFPDIEVTPQTETRRSRRSDAEQLADARAEAAAALDGEPDEPPARESGETPPPVTAPEDEVRALTDAAAAQGMSLASITEAVSRSGAAPPPPETSVAEEAAARLGADPMYVDLWQRCQDPGSYASEAEQRNDLLLLRTQSDAAVISVTQDRLNRAAQAQARAAAERDHLDRLASDRQFAGYLKDAKDRAGLLAYARQKGVTDLEVAARAYFFERQYRSGQTTQARARGAVIEPGSTGVGAATGGGDIPEAVVKGGMLSVKRYLERHRKT